VIGGGITGLAAARRLVKEHPDFETTLIERDTETGGKARTIHDDGFVVELGPESYIAAKEWMTELCRELGLADQLQTTRPENRGSMVLWDGRLHPTPEGLSGLVPTRIGPVFRSSLLSPVGKLRFMLDWIIPPRKDESDESLASFVSRRVGREAYERLIEPLMAGIYAGDGEKLSIAASFPQLRAAEREHGSLVRGVIRNRQRAQAAGRVPPAGFLTPKGGIGEIMRALTADIQARGVRVMTGTSVIALHERQPGNQAPTSPRYELTLSNGETRSADAVVLATPASVTADLLGTPESPLDAQASTLLRTIPFVSSVTMSLAYRREDVPHPLNRYGYVVARVQKRPILASTWTSSKWANRAPEGMVLLRAFIGRAGGVDGADLDDETVIRLARDEFHEILGITVPPRQTWIARWKNGSPQYTVGHLDRLAQIERQITTHPGLAVAGCSYHGVGLPDCLRSGERAADQVVSSLATP
jgi:oxygen-dependent protoporphyrinogen oxidase